MVLNQQQKLKLSLIIITMITLGALTYFYLVSPPSDAHHPSWGHVSFHVKDTYGNPLRNVNVTLWFEGDLMWTGFTDGEGETSKGHLVYACYTVTLTKKGVESHSLYFCLDDDNDHIKLYFTLNYSKFDLSLNITDGATDEPISNASILVYHYDYLEQYQEFTITSNISGFVTLFALEYDEYAIEVTHEDYFSHSKLTFMDEDRTVEIPLQAIPSGEDPGKDPKEWDFLTIGIGIAVGFILAVAVIWFFLLQRKLRGLE